MIGSDPSFTVSQFVAVFNQSMEMVYPNVGIVGELANFRVSKGRWVYFDLKDESCSVRFFGNVQQLPGPLENGLSLEVFGQPRLHSQYGFSINISSIRVVGEGSLAKAQAMLQKKLEKEGLFSVERKRALPYPPSRIGLITSVESAAYADFVKIIDQRWGNLHIELVDVLVQGTEAPMQLVDGIEYFNQMAVPPEVLVMIRGGGSADDLTAFSTEQVVRAVAASRIPTLVAIGHEVDISLAELAADRQASTPSNAAELLVPDADNELINLAGLKRQIYQTVKGIYAEEKQSTDETKRLLAEALSNTVTQNDSYIQRQKLILRALDPFAPLNRGFALVRNKQGKVVRTVKSAKTAKEISINLSDGRINAKVLGED